MVIEKIRYLYNLGIVSKCSWGLRENLSPLLSKLMVRLPLRSVLRFKLGCAEGSQISKYRLAFSEIPIGIWEVPYTWGILAVFVSGDPLFFSVQGTRVVYVGTMTPQDDLHRTLWSIVTAGFCPIPIGIWPPVLISTLPW